MQTEVVMTCVSKKEAKGYNGSNQFAIELEVPYNQDSVYWKMSGGTNIVLNTISKEANDMFTIGGEFRMIIKPNEAI